MMDDEKAKQYREYYLKRINDLKQYLVLDVRSRNAISVKSDAPEEIKKNQKFYIDMYNEYLIMNSGY